MNLLSNMTVAAILLIAGAQPAWAPFVDNAVPVLGLGKVCIPDRDTQARIILCPPNFTAS